MNRLLYQIHRWAGIGLALFMLIWFASGLIIMYAPPSALSRAEQLERREPLAPESGWLSLGEALRRSSPPESDLKSAPRVADARLVRQAGLPLWLIEDDKGQRFALSALDGLRHETRADEALRIAADWIAQDPDSAPLSQAPQLHHLDTGPQDSAVRNYENLRPFHRIGVEGSSRELLISARTGEVVRDTTATHRALYWAGNWIHLWRPLEAAGLSQDGRRSVLAWLAGIAFAASLTGLIIGWQRWRPGWAGRPTYSKGRTQPYQEAWAKWHFWAGLIGGSAALLWTLSGYLNNNPFELFSPAAPNRGELARYRGGPLPASMLDWQPVPLPAPAPRAPVVELNWRPLGTQAVLIGVTRDGTRIPQAAPGSVLRFEDEALIAATRRLSGAGLEIASTQTLTRYDSYYYPRRGLPTPDRPLPVLRVDLNDAGATRLYLDPQDGRLLLRQDDSRRAYRWLWSALHHWDLPGLRLRPLWDGWMLVWVGLGLVLAASSVVLGWRRLGKTFKPARRKPASKPASPSIDTGTPARLATEGQSR